DFKADHHEQKGQMMTADGMKFTLADTIAGYVTSYDENEDSFGLRTSDGREFQVWLAPNTYSSAIRNFGEAYLDTTAQMRDMLVPGRFLFTYGIFYPEAGEDRFLEAAESGTDYLREHMRATVESEGVVYWYHGVDVSGTAERKILASEFGDDLDAIPMYEQIYALAGPTQTYRITGDPRILDDIDKTVKLFDRFYRDPDKGGYFSHIDPVTLDPRSDTLGHN